MNYDEVKHGQPLIPSGGGFCGHCMDQPCICDRLESERRDRHIIAGNMDDFPDLPENLNFNEVYEALAAIEEDDAEGRLALMKKHISDPIFIKKMSIVVASKEAIRQYNFDHNISAYMSKLSFIANMIEELNEMSKGK